MSAHEKENGEKELNRVRLSCDADGQTEQRGGQPGQESKDSHSDAVHGEQTGSIHPSSATVRSVVLIFSGSRRSCWGCSFHSLFQREATQSLKEIPEKGKKEQRAFRMVACTVFNVQLLSHILCCRAWNTALTDAIHTCSKINMDALNSL